MKDVFHALDKVFTFQIPDVKYDCTVLSKKTGEGAVLPGGGTPL